MGIKTVEIKEGNYVDDIIMVRGDTLQLSISSIKTQEGEDYVLVDTDIVYLDVKKHAYDETPIFSKSVTAADYSGGILPITIYPADTVNLAVGDYCFDVRLVIDDDNIYTIVPMTKLKIVQNVTDIPNGGGS